MSLSKVEQERLDYAKTRLSNKQEEERILNLRYYRLNDEIKSLVDTINKLEARKNETTTLYPPM